MFLKFPCNAMVTYPPSSDTNFALLETENVYYEVYKKLYTLLLKWDKLITFIAKLLAVVKWDKPGQV